MNGQVAHPPTERAVLGAVILHGAAALDRMAGLRADDLTLRGLPELLEVARDLVAAGEAERMREGQSLSPCDCPTCQAARAAREATS